MDPILLVDDEKDNLEALNRLLRTTYAVTSTTSPFEALKLVQKTEFHVIVSDQRMPEMSGVEFLEKVKKLSPTSTRILLTGYTDIESVIDAINRGNIYRYIAKPWDPADLKQTIRQASEAFQLRRELDTKSEALVKSNAELKKALADLTLLDRAKARFLSLVSHELNTPLTVLSSFVELLSDKRNSFPAEIQQAVNSISGASRRFSEIVSEVLSYVKLETDNQLNLQTFDMGKELTKLQGDLKDDLKAKSLTLKIQGGATVKCDSEKMRLALVRLLKDAIARSVTGKEIKVEIGQKDSTAVMTISRSGEPLSSDAFTPFETSSPEMHHSKNLGLSLAICKSIIEKHGGSIASERTQLTITLG